MKLKIFILSLTILTAVACGTSRKENDEQSQDSTSVSQEATAMDESPGVYFENLKDGDQVKSPVIVQMGVRGMTVEPAGAVHDGMGHHHLIVDGTFEEAGVMVPSDATHIHYGKGQTSDTLALAPGKHTLTLQFANGVHASYGKDWSKTIGIDVIE
jgi:hypothetical protein